jgi:hypothetical protein
VQRNPTFAPKSLPAPHRSHRGFAVLAGVVVLGALVVVSLRSTGPRTGYDDASRPEMRGGGSVPGTPPSITCSVHSDPDQ